MTARSDSTPDRAAPVGGGPSQAALVVAAAMTEGQLEELVRQLALQLGVYRYHTLRSKGSPPGWPDDVFVGVRVMYRELKRVGERPTAAQRRVLDTLAAAGQDVGVWTPVEWLDGTICRELVALRVPPVYRRPATE